LSGRVEQISNATLAVPAGASAQRRSLIADIDGAARGEAWDATANAQYAINSSNLPQLGQDSYSFGLRANRQFERDTVGFASSLRRESTLTSGLASFGASFALAQRQTLSLAPTWQHPLTERLSLVTDASVSAVTYGDAPPNSGLVNYTSTSATGGLAYSLSPSTRLRLTANASRFRTDPFTSSSNVMGWSASVQHTFSERWTVAASFGPTRIDSRFASGAQICTVPVIFCEAGLVPFTFVPAQVERVSTGNAWNASAIYTPSERTTLSLLTMRAVTPSGGGALTVLETTSATLAHSFTDRLSASADAAQSSQTTVAVGAGTSTQARRAGASPSWQLDERLWLDGGIRWQQVNVAGGGVPESTTVFLALRYSLARQVLRRRRSLRPVRAAERRRAPAARTA
jgi:hypothetical protein